jgi:hypothetical protein
MGDFQDPKGATVGFVILFFLQMNNDHQILCRKAEIEFVITKKRALLLSIMLDVIGLNLCIEV